MLSRRRHDSASDNELSIKACKWCFFKISKRHDPSSSHKFRFSVNSPKMQFPLSQLLVALSAIASVAAAPVNATGAENWTRSDPDSDPCQVDAVTRDSWSE